MHTTNTFSYSFPNNFVNGFWKTLLGETINFNNNNNFNSPFLVALWLALLDASAVAELSKLLSFLFLLPPFDLPLLLFLEATFGLGKSVTASWFKSRKSFNDFKRFITIGTWKTLIKGWWPLLAQDCDWMQTCSTGHSFSAQIYSKSVRYYSR